MGASGEVNPKAMRVMMLQKRVRRTGRRRRAPDREIRKFTGGEKPLNQGSDDLEACRPLRDHRADPTPLT